MKKFINIVKHALGECDVFAISPVDLAVNNLRLMMIENVHCFLKDNYLNEIQHSFSM